MQFWGERFKGRLCCADVCWSVWLNGGVGKLFSSLFISDLIFPTQQICSSQIHFLITTPEEVSGVVNLVDRETVAALLILRT